MPHYYSEEQTSDLRINKININVKNVSFPLFSGSGVFSKKRLDKGTEVLLKGMQIKDNSKVLDLGCGIGVVGIYVNKQFPSAEVTLSDVNRRAFLLTRKNLALNNVEAKTVNCDGFAKIKETFDTVLFNPPQVAGKETCFRLFQEAYEHLNKDGTLQIVARHNKGGKSYSEKMKEIFGNVEEIHKGSGYRVYLSQKKS
ncbi:class I SAM-dependent methyltransferase [Bacteroidota bacterium]